jgi:hypothetical protein
MFSGLSLIISALCCGTAANAQVPAAVDVPGAKTIATFQGVGAQVYECKAGSDGKLAWSFREPIASLIDNGKTVGRHYGGPTWEDVDGSKVVAKASGNAPGATASDIPWLKLEVTKHTGRGLLSKVTTIQRLNTHGGALSGGCEKAGDFKCRLYGHIRGPADGEVTPSRGVQSVQHVRQLGYVGRDAPRLVVGHQLGSSRLQCRWCDRSAARRFAAD